MAQQHLHGLPQGYQLQDYRIRHVLGSGGFGITYLAEETEIGRTVAIKEYMPAGIAARDRDGSTVRPLSSTDGEDFEYGLQRFRDEAKTLVSFRHHNIVSVHRYFQANGTAYLVMEYVDGSSLDEILRRDGTLTEDEIREILVPLCAGLEQVHAAGFLHRDIKPANIYIRQDGTPMLIDFGSARQALGQKSKTLTAIVSGGYAPFEQYSSSGNQGPWTDIYGFGATLYRALAGSDPPEAISRIEDDTYRPIAEAAAVPVGEQMCKAIDWALKMRGAERPQTIAAWREAIFNGAAEGDKAADKPGADTDTPSPTAEKPTPLAERAAAKPDKQADKDDKAVAKSGPEYSEQARRGIIILHLVLAYTIVAAIFASGLLVDQVNTSTTNLTTKQMDAQDLLDISIGVVGVAVITIGALLFYVYAGRDWARLTMATLMLIIGFIGFAGLIEFAAADAQAAKRFLPGLVSLFGLASGYGLLGLALVIFKSVHTYMSERRSQS